MSEYTYVERPFLDQLQALGWTVIDQGPGIPQDPTRSLRSDFREVILKDTLLRQIIAINRDEQSNTWLTPKQVNDLVDDLLKQPHSSLLEINKDFFSKLVDDYPRVDRNEVTGEENPVVKLIDLDRPQENVYHAINQFRIDTPGGTKDFIIPDIVLFVNGLPLVVIEAKDSNIYTSNPMYEAYRQLRRYANQRESEYQEGEERLFHWNLFNIITTGDEAKLGTITSGEKFYYFWKDIYPERYKDFTAPLGRERAQEKLIQGVLPPQTLLDLLRHCTLFMTLESGVEIKIIARYQQYRAIGKIVDRLLTKETPDDRSGVVWHTQGSGKSLTMVMLVRKLRSHPLLKDYKVVMVNDRTDLEKQLGGTATLTNDPVDRVRNSRELREKLSTETSNVVMVMVHKFQDRKEEENTIVGKTLKSIAADPVPRYGNFEVVNDSDRILILIDEAHRTQSSDLGDNLFQAFPNATRIAFTGTPLITERHQGHRTYERFGTYIDKYRLQDAVADGATIQILYEGKTGDSAIRNKSTFDRKFEDLIKDHSEEEIAAIKRRYGSYRDVLESEEMIGQKAEDMVEHYLDQIFPNGFKAQVVTTSVKAAVRYQKALRKALGEYVQRHRGKTEQEFLDRVARIQVHAVVTSQGTNEDGDITVARKDSQQANAVTNFKKAFKPDDDSSYIAILVVCDMLLTGFDAPIEQVMYIDKKMKEHNLLQAIARVNRTHEGKTRGYVVDYVGIANHLKEAMSIYGGEAEEILESLKSIDSEIPVLESRYRRLIQLFEEYGVEEIEDFVQQRITDTQLEFDVLENCIELGREIKFRANFDVYLKNFLESMDIILPNKAALAYKICSKRFAYIHAKMKHRYKDATLTFGDTGAKIRNLINEYLVGLGIDSRIPPVELFSVNFDKEVRKNTSKKAIASEMEHAIKKHIKVSWQDDPAMYKKLSEKLEEVLKKYRDNYEQLVIEFEAITTEIKSGRKENPEGLNEVESLLFDNLLQFSNDPESSRPALLNFIPSLLTLIRGFISREHFWDKSSQRKDLEAEIEQALIIEGLDQYFANPDGLIADLMVLVKRRANDIV